MDADKILGSVINISQRLPSDAAVGVWLDLDSILYTTVMQAASEVHCVAGGLRHGYEQPLARTLRHAASLARVRKLDTKVAETAERTALITEVNQPVAHEPIADRRMH